ncbi:MAG TPA: zf-HC2 domain-containing protein [Acidobacteriaceae bacterium]|nr:zf-HC2 domain-containing protein [Acidobacteriaceae bacterium]
MASQHELEQQMQPERECVAAQAAFSSYLDGALSGVEMGRIADHLQGCVPCAAEFEGWRAMQTALADMGPARPPQRLQQQIKTALGEERERGSNLPLSGRVALTWRSSVAPLAVQTAGGMAAAVLLAAGLFRLFGPGVAVQANDDGMAQVIAPHYLYSQVPPTAVETGRDVPVLIDAKVDTQGRVYDYTILEGPADPSVQLQVEQNLLSSVFKPATVFGVPVDGHVMVTYTGVSVHAYPHALRS